MFLLFLYDETGNHLFIECIQAKNLWISIRDWLKYCIDMPEMSDQLILFGQLPVVNKNRLLNQIILLYKMILYQE